MRNQYWTPTHIFSARDYPSGTLIALLPTGIVGQMQFLPVESLCDKQLPPGWFFPIPPPPQPEIIESELLPESPAPETEHVPVV